MVDVRRLKQVIATEIILVTAAGLAVVAALGAQSVYRHNQSQDVAPISYEVAPLECSVKKPAPQTIGNLALKIKNNSEKELAAQGIDPLARPTVDNLENIADDAMPFIGSALKNDKVYRPRIVLTDKELGFLEYFSWDARVGIKKSHLTLGDAKRAVVHEFIGHQYLALGLPIAIIFPYYKAILTEEEGPLFRNPKFIELTVYEVLARQALKGDELARYAFADKLDYAMAVYLRHSNRTPTKYTEEHLIRPAEAVLDVVGCGISRYDHTSLFGVMSLLLRENKQFDAFETKTSPIERLIRAE